MMSSFWNDIKYSFNVSVPPNPVVIFDETGTRRTTFVGPYLTGDSMTLVCDAFGGKIIMYNLWYYITNIIWFSDYTIFNHKLKFLFRNSASSSYLVEIRSSYWWFIYCVTKWNSEERNSISNHRSIFSTCWIYLYRYEYKLIKTSDKHGSCWYEL